MVFGVDFSRFLETLGATFVVFDALETYLKMDGFSVVSRIQRQAGVEGKLVAFLSPDNSLTADGR